MIFATVIDVVRWIIVMEFVPVEYKQVGFSTVKSQGLCPPAGTAQACRGGENSIGHGR